MPVVKKNILSNIGSFEIFFSKKITIVNNDKNIQKDVFTEREIDLQFFPEGGYAVKGLNNRIAFKAIGTDGYGKRVEGKIVDSEDNFIGNIKSFCKIQFVINLFISIFHNKLGSNLGIPNNHGFLKNNILHAFKQ